MVTGTRQEPRGAPGARVYGVARRADDRPVAAVSRISDSWAAAAAEMAAEWLATGRTT